MKKLIALVAVTAMVAAVPVSAFWTLDNDNSYGAGHSGGRGDFSSRGGVEGEATFSMTMTGRGRSEADFRGTGDMDGNWAGHGYEHPYWYGVQYDPRYGAYRPWILQPYLVAPPEESTDQ